MNFAKMLPMCPELKKIDPLSLREIRLRAGHKAVFHTSQGFSEGEKVFSREEVLMAAQILTFHSLPLYTRQMQKGFIPLSGGHRMGICGKIFEENGQLHLTEISSLCIRTAQDFPHAADCLWPLIKRDSLLIAGPPGSGKTTFLRSLIRLHADSGENVAVADERGEIAACFEGICQMNIGSADVISLMEKEKAMLLLLRSMSPQWIATDELGSEDEAKAIAYIKSCGVRVLCTVHAPNAKEIKRNRNFRILFENHVFDQMVILHSPDEAPEMVSPEAE